MNDRIIIVGAGAAGLAAARQLSAKHFKVTVLESRPVAGGRIRSQEISNSVVVEHGAEFIHGRLPITLGLCTEANIEVVPTEGKMYRRNKGKWVEEMTMFEEWDSLLRKMQAVKKDMTLNEFLQQHYSDDKYAELRFQVRAYAQGFDLADPDRVSVKYLHDEWSAEDEVNFHIPRGYCALIDFLEQQCVKNGCEIHKGDAVRQIDWSKGEVTVYTAGGKKYSGEKVVVTVPPAVLTNIAGPTAINFTPPIDTHIRAAGDIGYGAVIKFVILFTEALWKPDTQFIFSDEMIPTWWTQLPLTAPVLTGWLGGPPATGLGQHSDSELLQIAYTSLANVFEKTREEIASSVRQAFVFNWLADPDALGAYTYSTIHTALARHILIDPLQDTVYFAGEGLYEGKSPGTVEAALASGLQASDRIIFPK